MLLTTKNPPSYLHQKATQPPPTPLPLTTFLPHQNHSLFPVAMDTIRSLVEDKPLVIFSKNSCCVSHSMKQLITSYGANPTIYELDELPNGHEIERALQKLGCKPAVPAVFIGQELVGGANDVLSLQVQGKLVPMMMNAGAIWIWHRTN